ncbi:MAG TPA: bacterial transcriptional activator domain-containing protein [Symbiobacteriaceae bacterium]|nr:bacterial transcriptional activator domain-containing protein [Symbiobacteriaceae bacterium]
MAELEICLLGPSEVSWDFVPVAPAAWRSPLAAKLLKIVLVMRPDSVSVAEACRLLGSGTDPAELDRLVGHVCRVLEPGAAMRVEDGQVRFVPGPHCWIDLDAMQEHYRAGLRAAARGEMFPAILAFQEADALYQGALLEELNEPWVAMARRGARELYTEILDRLAEGHAVLCRYQDAVGFCHKALSHDPLREKTYQRMMVYYFYLGDMAGAAEAYQACCDTLQGAGRKVSLESRTLWETLSSCQMPGSQAAPSFQPE